MLSALQKNCHKNACQRIEHSCSLTSAALFVVLALSGILPASPAYAQTSGDQSGAYWEREPGKRQSAIVFVHGFNSNSADAWKNADGRSWPSLVSADPEFDNEGLLVVNLDHTVLGASRNVSELGAELNRVLHAALGDRSIKRIIIVAHSLGGLIARKFFIDYGAGFANTRFSLLAFGTPWQGARRAGYLTRVCPGCTTALIRDMTPGEGSLEQATRAYSEGNGRLVFVGCASGKQDDWADGTHPFCDAVVSLQSDHTSLVKPSLVKQRAQDLEPHTTLRAWYRQIPLSGVSPILAANYSRRECDPGGCGEVVGNSGRWGLAQTFRVVRSGWLDHVKVELSSSNGRGSADLVVMDLSPNGVADPNATPDEQRMIAHATYPLRATEPGAVHWATALTFREPRVRVSADRQYAVAVYVRGDNQGDTFRWHFDNGTNGSVQGNAFEKTPSRQWRTIAGPKAFAFEVAVIPDAPTGSCQDYELETGVDAACSSGATSDGYYWKKIRKFSSWGSQGLVWGTLAVCDAAHANSKSKGYSGNWWVGGSSVWNPVVSTLCPNTASATDPERGTCVAMPANSQWPANRPLNTPDPACDADPRCGVYEFECQPIPPSPRKR